MVCPLCDGTKSLGLVCCWECYRRHGLRYGNPEIERLLDAAELAHETEYDFLSRERYHRKLINAADLAFELYAGKTYDLGSNSGRIAELIAAMLLYAEDKEENAQAQLWLAQEVFAEQQYHEWMKPPWMVRAERADDWSWLAEVGPNLGVRTDEADLLILWVRREKQLSDAMIALSHGDVRKLHGLLSRWLEKPPSFCRRAYRWIRKFVARKPVTA
jgi:hypothetical protein